MWLCETCLRVLFCCAVCTVCMYLDTVSMYLAACIFVCTVHVCKYECRYVCKYVSMEGKYAQYSK